MTVNSMTGFGGAEGVAGPFAWRWDIRSVNARGLDLRLRLPEGWDALEPALRRRASAALRRGAVTAQLKVEGAGAAAPPRLDRAALAAAVAAAADAAAAAAAAGLDAAPVDPAGLLALRGVWEAPRAAEATEARAEAEAALLDGFDMALSALAAARRAEGLALAAALGAVLDRVAATVDEAEAAHRAQAADAPARLREKVAALLGAGAPVAEDRLAQELALLAVRQDVREEIDRLRAHVGAVRALLAGDGPAGRELDFLTQELNREANTLCSKAASGALTQAGLALKVLIDQLREQGQNVE